MQNGAVAKTYIYDYEEGLPHILYEEIRKYVVIYEKAVAT
jgi:hypothetical protein